MFTQQLLKCKLQSSAGDMQLSGAEGTIHVHVSNTHIPPVTEKRMVQFACYVHVQCTCISGHPYDCGCMANSSGAMAPYLASVTLGMHEGSARINVRQSDNSCQLLHVTVQN